MKQISIALLSLFVFGCASLDKATPTTHQINIDGSGSDWPELDLYDQSVGIQYGVTYDNTNLYVLAKAYDQDAIRQILASGLTVWVDANGKKKKEVGVKYPMLEGERERGRREREPGGVRGERAPMGGVNELLNTIQLNNMMVKGIFSEDMQLVQKNLLKVDLDVMIGFDSTHNLLYEMKMPLVLLKQKTKGDLEKLALGFEVSDDARPTQGTRPDNVGAGGGGRGSGGRGGGGGGRSGGRPSGGGMAAGGQRGGGPTSGSQSTSSNQTEI
ncbi:MAG: hypothetical protein ABJH57_01635, partial [Cyclobacteriaceae bacterium]